ncbi:hypothetical protein RFI_04570 [Reticulomyxa filosa]|uniref:Uncharacterized protein n=1 Tax=Reticulomyxa filosa TaxID=46433 RepID=X6P2T3_RETFI|nr:hypothetical protein RFI_04570 [Reticulomyxa filosa]|eukprot:ETO32546.1 hypothetical protein RFI_04570 [Reticulomyxa filosa]
MEKKNNLFFFPFVVFFLMMTPFFFLKGQDFDRKWTQIKEEEQQLENVKKLVQEEQRKLEFRQLEWSHKMKSVANWDTHP